MRIRLRLALVGLLVVALSAGSALAATIQIQQVGITWSPSDVTISPGDTVEWIWTSGIHTITSGTGAADPNSGVLFDSPLTSGTSLFSFTYNSVGDFPFYCAPHEVVGMTGIVRVRNTATHQVQQVGLTFVPDNLTIMAGDTVEWIWSSGVHTVTSGTGAADPDVGDLFDDPLDSGNQTVSFTFNTVGSVDYFCRPHEALNMDGVIQVDQPTAIRAPSQFAIATLYPAKPSPFNPRTSIRFDLERESTVSLKVYNASGRLVRVLVDAELRGEGPHRSVWNGLADDGSAVASGVYHYRLTAGSTTLADSMVLVR